MFVRAGPQLVQRRRQRADAAGRQARARRQQANLGIGGPLRRRAARSRGRAPAIPPPSAQASAGAPGAIDRRARSTSAAARSTAPSWQSASAVARQQARLVGRQRGGRLGQRARLGARIRPGARAGRAPACSVATIAGGSQRSAGQAVKGSGAVAARPAPPRPRSASARRGASLGAWASTACSAARAALASPRSSWTSAQATRAARESRCPDDRCFQRARGSRQVAVAGAGAAQRVQRMGQIAGGGGGLPGQPAGGFSVAGVEPVERARRRRDDRRVVRRAVDAPDPHARQRVRRLARGVDARSRPPASRRRTPSRAAASRSRGLASASRRPSACARPRSAMPPRSMSAVRSASMRSAPALLSPGHQQPDRRPRGHGERQDPGCAAHHLLDIGKRARRPKTTPGCRSFAEAFAPGAGRARGGPIFPTDGPPCSTS